jgi:hypothetical protein
MRSILVPPVQTSSSNSSWGKDAGIFENMLSRCMGESVDRHDGTIQAQVEV